MTDQTPKHPVAAAGAADSEVPPKPHRFTGDPRVTNRPGGGYIATVDDVVYQIVYKDFALYAPHFWVVCGPDMTPAWLDGAPPRSYPNPGDALRAVCGEPQ